MTETKLALFDFTERYVQKWQDERSTLPCALNYGELQSPCILKMVDESIFWQPYPQQHHSMHVVEEVINIQVNSDIADFYCSQYCGDMSAQFGQYQLKLTQVWNSDDFSHIEQNIIGHLDMLRRKKRRPTIFIATIESAEQFISVYNQTGEVILENLNSSEPVHLSGSLSQFLKTLTPVVE